MNLEHILRTDTWKSSSTVPVEFNCDELPDLIKSLRKKAAQYTDIADKLEAALIDHHIQSAMPDEAMAPPPPVHQTNP